MAWTFRHIWLFKKTNFRMPWTKENKKHPVFLSRTLQQDVCVLTIVVWTCSHYSCGHVVTAVSVLSNCKWLFWFRFWAWCVLLQHKQLPWPAPLISQLTHPKTHTRTHTKTVKPTDWNLATQTNTHMHILNWSLDRVKLSTFLPGMLTPW